MERYRTIVSGMCTMFLGRQTKLPADIKEEEEETRASRHTQMERERERFYEGWSKQLSQSVSQSAS